MCQALPGPRCASHTRANLQQYHQKLRSLGEQYAQQINQYQIGDSTPENQRVKESIDATNREIEIVFSKIKRIQREYNGTPTGQRELEAQYKNSQSNSERERIKRDIRDARILRSWHKNALRRKKLGLPVQAKPTPLLDTPTNTSRAMLESAPINSLRRERGNADVRVLVGAKGK